MVSVSGGRREGDHGECFCPIEGGGRRGGRLSPSYESLLVLQLRG